jgi:precorrin-6B methylase 1
VTYDPTALGAPVDLWGWKGLTIVGTGIRTALQTTPEARLCIVQASKVLYLVSDPLSEAWLKGMNSTSESLFTLYEPGKPRPQTYSEIVGRIMSALRATKDVCVVFYGHPGVFVGPAVEAMRQARIEGLQARMLPGVSAMDNLFSDLGLDPGITGLQTHEATAFLLYRPRFEPTAALILWQVGVIGERTWRPGHQPKPDTLLLLRDRLLEAYPAEHTVVIYEAAILPFQRPLVHLTTISDIQSAELSTSSTMFIPPLPRPPPDPPTLRFLNRTE